MAQARVISFDRLILGIAAPAVETVFFVIGVALLPAI
jgi:hypothetical protein